MDNIRLIKIIGHGIYSGSTIFDFRLCIQSNRGGTSGAGDATDGDGIGCQEDFPRIGVDLLGLSVRYAICIGRSPACTPRSPTSRGSGITAAPIGDAIPSNAPYHLYQ